MFLKGSHFISIDQITSATDLETIFSLAFKLELFSSRKKTTRILEGAVLANLFFEPSTRTRFSFGTAFTLLGGNVQEITGTDSTSISKGESIFDTSRVISGYVDIMVVRHPDIQALAKFANASKIPVINAGNGIGEHPSQALLDIYTIVKEFGNGQLANLRNLSICMVGDLKHGRTVHSLAKLLSIIGGIRFNLISPPALKMPHHIIKLLEQRNNDVVETDNFKTGVRDSNVIYLTRIQKERFENPDDFLKYAGSYNLDLDFYEQFCSSEPIIMHPLPRDSSLKKPEISEDLNFHPKLMIFKQSDNGIPVRMALFALILGLTEEQIFAASQDVPWHYTFS